MSKVNGDRISALMDKKGVTQSEMAERVGITKSMMCYIARGLRNPNIETLSRIANELDCTIDELVVR